MEKKFLLELEKIKSLMDYDRSNQSKFYDKPIKSINEQTFQEYIQYDSPELTNSGTKSNTGSYFSEKKTFYIGKDTNYPFIFYFGVNQIDKLPVVEGTKVYTIEPGMSSKDFIPDVKIGTIKDDLGVDHPNQEYIEKERTVRENDKNVKKLQKYCLPDKTFWNLPEHIGRVWKFESPASSEGGMFSAIQDFTKTFAMVLQEKEETFYTIDSGGNQVKQTGRNAAMRCRGGDNGWGCSKGSESIEGLGEENVQAKEEIGEMIRMTSGIRIPFLFSKIKS